MATLGTAPTLESMADLISAYFYGTRPRFEPDGKVWRAYSIATGKRLSIVIWQRRGRFAFAHSED